MLELYLLFGFMIICALIAIEAKDLLSSVVALGALGLGVSISFLVLKAPDVAITQLVVELLALIILIRATLKMDIPFSASGRWFINTVITVGFIAVLLFAASKCLNELPRFGHPEMRIAGTYLKEGISQVGASNLVTAVALDYRAYDTLGEATVLFTAVVAIMAILRNRGKRDGGGKDTRRDDDD